MRPIVAFLLLAGVGCTAEREQRAETHRGAPVIIISIDTLRADHLPAYGYDGVTTPAIDALRADSILYANAWSHCPMTLPSHVSLLTGKLPYEHGVRNNIGYRFDADRHDSIPAMLRREGYATGAAVSAYVMRAGTGLGHTFDFYDDRGDPSRAGAETVAAATSWISGQVTTPFFFLLHLFEPHSPYDAAEPYRSAAATPYDAEIAAADAVVGRFIEILKAKAIYDRAIILLLSDHGEGLGDHGESEHGVFLYREALHVPLMIKLPRSERRGETVPEPVQLIDVAPTIAALTGTALRSDVRGASLIVTPPKERQIYSETLLPRIHFGWSELRSLAGERHHFIEAPRSELYDYVADPGEKNNLARDERRIFASMRDVMKEHAAPVETPQIDDEEAEKLAALGYIGQARSDTGTAKLPDPKDVIGDLEELRRATELERSGDLTRAGAAYRKIADRNPRFADAWLHLATIQERAGERNAAIDSYKRALIAAPELTSEVAFRVALILVEQDRLPEALAFLDAVPPTRNLESTRGDILARMDRVPEAIAAFEKEIASFPQNREAYSRLALLLYAGGRSSEARAVLERLVRANPGRESLELAADAAEAAGETFPFHTRQNR